MGFKKSELLEEVRNKRIDFLGPDGQPSGKFLSIDHRVRAMAYGQKKMLMHSVTAIQGSIKRMQKLSKDLDNKSLSEVERERTETERNTIIEQINEFSVPLVDYLAGKGNRPAAIARWDFLNDDGTEVPITREEIEDLDEETISFIAWQLLSGGNETGEAKGETSQEVSPQTDSSSLSQIGTSN